MDNIDPKIYTWVIGILITIITGLLGIIGWWTVRYITNSDSAFKDFVSKNEEALKQFDAKIDALRNDVVTVKECEDIHFAMESRLTDGNGLFSDFSKKINAIVTALTVLAEGIVSLMNPEDREHNEAVIALRDRLRNRGIHPIEKI